MRNRCLASLGAVAAAGAFVLLGPAPAVAQAPASAKGWTAPRTPDGKPDLQGAYTNASVTPLERPKDLGTKEFFTEQELADREKREKDRLAVAELGRATEAGTADDVHYDFAQYGLDRGQSKVAWSLRTSLIVGSEGTVPSQIPEARKRNADRAALNRGHEFDSVQSRPLSARCLVLGQESVPALPGGYNNNLQIQQGAGYVAIMMEMNHSVRIIPTDGRPHLPSTIRQWLGDSRGHWEGDTLVVDVTNFTDQNPFRGSSEKLHVVERFTPVDKDTVLYRFTVEDPVTWDKPWTVELPISKTGQPVYEFACHEGNYGLANTIHGARVDEEEAAAKKAGK